VEIAQEIQRLRQAENFARDMRGAQNVQHRGKQQLVNYRGVWVDERFGGTERVTKVRWGSNAYFRLARERPDLRDIFTLGQQVVVVTARNQALLVDIEAGLEELSDAHVKELFTDLEPEEPDKDGNGSPAMESTGSSSLLDFHRHMRTG
jgi:hypothetical protein